ncbi:MAG TPA: hypothetical protein VII32_03605 [Thermoanaerobaculia bacterium]
MATVPLDSRTPSQKRIADALQHRFFLRVHMTAILTATILVGLATTWVLYRIHLNVFAIRYGLAVITAYAAFVGFIKVWLWYVEYCGRRRSSGTADDWFDCINFSGGGSSSGSGVSFSGGGGKFGGGGASGSWASESNAQAAPLVVAPPAKSSSSSTSTKSSSKSSGGGGDDLGELILVLLIIALVLAIIASFVWIVWAAPTILSEVVFNAVLAGALARHTHRATCGEWIGGVIKKTAIPFALILALSVTMGWWAQHICPSALRLRDAFHCVKSQ